MQTQERQRESLTKKRDGMTQTDNEFKAGASIEEKLRRLEQPNPSSDGSAAKFLEEKMMLYQQQCEKR